MKADSADVEEIIQLGSFHKGLSAEVKARRLILYGLAFGVGIVIGVIVSDNMKR